jgi:hypothetical protein
MEITRRHPIQHYDFTVDHRQEDGEAVAFK